MFGCYRSAAKLGALVTDGKYAAAISADREPRSLRLVLGQVVRLGGLRWLALVFLAAALGAITELFPNSRAARYVVRRFNLDNSAPADFR